MAFDPSAVAGRTLEFSATSPISYGDIPGIDALNYAGQQRTDINVTSISDEDEQFVQGRRANGTLGFNLFYDPDFASHAALLANFNDNAQPLGYFRDTMANTGAKVRTFRAYVQQWNETADRDGANMVAVVLKISGAITDTP